MQRNHKLVCSLLSYSQKCRKSTKRGSKRSKNQYLKNSKKIFFFIFSLKRLILFLGCEKFKIDTYIGITGYGCTHYEWEFDQEDDTLGGNAADGMDATKLFGKGDTIGCGVLLIHPSATAKWAKCALCEQPRAWVFFTKNGCILGGLKFL